MVPWEMLEMTTSGKINNLANDQGAANNTNECATEETAIEEKYEEKK